MARPARHRWCLLIHSLPARPLYLRARIRRLLAESGAAPLRKAVYALPDTPAALESLRRIAVEIEGGGGSAMICQATFPDGAAERSVIRACGAERHRQYREWSAAADREIAGAPAPERVARLRERLDALRALDRFGAPGGAQARARLARLERHLPKTRPSRRGLAGLTWVTRRGLHVDRIACAWIVRRFVDPTAAFRFTSTPDAPLAKGEIGFDMPGAEITHERGGCSVETLVRRASIDDPAAIRITEMVHDMDLRDARFGHAETAGFEQLLLGLLASHPRDEDRLARGLELLDALYVALGRGDAPGPAAKPAPRIAIPPALDRRRPRP